jgi:hypothetical protein
MRRPLTRKAEFIFSNIKPVKPIVFGVPKFVEISEASSQSNFLLDGSSITSRNGIGQRWAFWNDRFWRNADIRQTGDVRQPGVVASVE